MKIYCNDHSQAVKPLMVPFGKSSLGQPHMCARCCRVLYMGRGIVTALSPQGGVITAEKNITFRSSDLATGFAPYVGTEVTYEIRLRDDNALEAACIRPAVNGGQA